MASQESHYSKAQEEDWSEMMDESTNGFSQYEHQVVNIGKPQRLKLECVSQLSPLDMMNLSNGEHDATGHRVWMGAYLFVEVVARKALSEAKYFTNKRVLELGCGTGIAGITLLSSGLPMWMTLTDSDPAVVELCRRNCKNTSASQKYSVCQLKWGDSLRNTGFEWVDPAGSGDKMNRKLMSSCFAEHFDTVLATDVLYDISGLRSLLQTASEALRPGGHFIMSHVPRASLPGMTSVATAEELETFISKRAKSHSLVKSCKVTTCSLSRTEEALNSVTFEEMEDAGAAILIYQKCDLS